MFLSILPVMRAVPSWFHLPAITAPLCASTLFSMRPILDTIWNFPLKTKKVLAIWKFPTQHGADVGVDSH